MTDDTISRSEAINAVRKAKGKGEAHRMLVQLPPAQPTGTNTVQVDDCISRQAAISEIMEDLEDRSLHDDPATPEDYAEGYDEGIRNAAAIVLQMPSAQPVNIAKLQQNCNQIASDCISRAASVDAIDEIASEVEDGYGFQYAKWREYFCNLPSAQPERDIPKKPIETIDRACGIPSRQAVCPNCDYYLGHVAFLGDYEGKKITYCETCGQAIDWEGWEFDE